MGGGTSDPGGGSGQGDCRLGFDWEVVAKDPHAGPQEMNEGEELFHQHEIFWSGSC